MKFFRKSGVNQEKSELIFKTVLITGVFIIAVFVVSSFLANMQVRAYATGNSKMFGLNTGPGAYWPLLPGEPEVLEPIELIQEPDPLDLEKIIPEPPPTACWLEYKYLDNYQICKQMMCDDGSIGDLYDCVQETIIEPIKIDTETLNLEDLGRLEPPPKQCYIEFHFIDSTVCEKEVCSDGSEGPLRNCREETIIPTEPTDDCMPGYIMNAEGNCVPEFAP